MSHSQSTSGTRSARSVATGSEGTRRERPGSVSPCALPLRHTVFAESGRAISRRTAKDGGAGRRETPVPGGAVQCLLRPFSRRKIRQRHCQHQRGERCVFIYLFSQLPQHRTGGSGKRTRRCLLRAGHSLIPLLSYLTYLHAAMWATFFPALSWNCALTACVLSVAYILPSSRWSLAPLWPQKAASRRCAAAVEIQLIYDSCLN